MTELRPTKEQKYIATDICISNPFVKQWVTDQQRVFEDKRLLEEQAYYLKLSVKIGKNKFNRINFFQGLCIGFIIGATIMKIVLP
jgi:hypothetical protein